MSAGKGLQEEGMPMRRQRVTHLLWALIGSLGLSLGLSCDAADATGANSDDVIDVLRVVWQASSGSSIQPADDGEPPA